MLADYAPWNARLDALVLLVAGDERDIVAWRIDAERARREAGQGGLSDAEAARLIERFLPPIASGSPVCSRASSSSPAS